MKFLILLLFILSLPYSIAQAEEDKPFKRQIYVVGVGQVRLQLFAYGEPISDPLRFKIHVKCEKSKAWKEVAEYYLCDFGQERFDAATRTLEFDFLSGRVNPNDGQSFCDQANKIKMELSQLCKPMSAK